VPDPIKLSDRRQCQACAHWRKRDCSTGTCKLSGKVTFCDATCERWKKARANNAKVQDDRGS